MMEKEEKKLFGQKCIVAVAIVLVFVAFVAMQTVNSYIFDVFTLAVSLLASFEIADMLTKMGKPNYKWMIVAYPVLMYFIFLVTMLLGYGGLVLFVESLILMALMFLLTFIASGLLLKNDTKNDAFRVSTGMTVSQFAFYKSTNTLFGMYYPSFLMMFLYLINHIGTLGFESITANFDGLNIGVLGIIMVICIATFTDTFANIFGSMIKGPKLCPKISPNKTISGFCFGLLGGVVATTAIYFVFNAIFAGALSSVGLIKFMVVGLFGAVVSSIGDLVESYIKRRAGVKDASNILLSHGGILDRFDSFSFAVPYVFICMLLMLA